jgi:hypothetical protein
MSNIFNAFLGGVLGSKGDVKDYQHANRLYVQNNYARAPKHGFLYFVAFNINEYAVQDRRWNYSDLGLLVKKIDLPKFTAATETINQYNRKTVVQTHIKYNPIAVDFHDDNSEITRNLWVNYYKYYYADGTYQSPTRVFGDTKYGVANNLYGLNNFQLQPFFKSVDIFVLHKHKFSQYTLLNPLITDWSHDTVDQSDGNKILANKMSLAYEAVYYNQGTIRKNDESGAFTAVYYDTSPSPLSISGKGVSSLFGAGGVISGAEDVLGTLENADNNPFEYLKAGIQANNLIKNIGSLSKGGLVNEANNIIGNALNGVVATDGGSRTGTGLVGSAIAGAQQYTQTIPVNLTKQ